MKLKNKVARKAVVSQEVRARKELEFLKLVESRIHALQGAKIGASGLEEVFCFLAGESNDELLNVEAISVGLGEIASTLHRCLHRETDAMEREVWGRVKLLELGDAAPRRLARRAARS